MTVGLTSYASGILAPNCVVFFGATIPPSCAHAGRRRTILNNTGSTIHQLFAQGTAGAPRSPWAASQGQDLPKWPPQRFAPTLRAAFLR